MDVDEDIQEMKNEALLSMEEPTWTMLELFRSKPHAFPLLIVCAVTIAQQLSGINVVFYYSDTVFKSAGIPETQTQYATLGCGIINVLMTIASVPLIERSGRRPLLIGGMIGMIISAIVITFCLKLQESFAWLSYLSIACTVSFVISFAIGLGPIPHFIGAELFKQGPRPAAMSFAGLCNWTANFLVGITFPSMQTGAGPFSFLLFIGFTAFFLVVIFKYLPETKNKTFEEIAVLMGLDRNSYAHPKVSKDAYSSVPILEETEVSSEATEPHMNGNKPV